MAITANGSDLALSIFVAAVLGGSLALLGVVSWIFWKAARRDAEADRAARTGLHGDVVLDPKAGEPE